MRTYLFAVVSLFLVGVAPSSAQENDALWKDLADADAAKAYRAIWAFTQTPGETARHFAQNLKPAVAPEPATVARLLEELGSDKFVVREKAYVAIGAMGSLMEADLRKTLQANPTLETRQRVIKLLDKLAGPITTDELRQTRAIEILERLRTPAAKALLADYAKGTPGSRLTQDAREALERLANAPAPGNAPKQATTDLYGDALPSGATGRLGTVLFRRDFEGAFGQLSGFAFLPDGKSVILGGESHEVQIWDINTGHATHHLKVAPEGSYASRSGFALSPDGKRLATGVSHRSIGNQPAAREIRVFAVPSGELIRTFPRDDKGGDWALAFSPDGKVLFSCSGYDDVLRVEDIATGDELARRAVPRDNGGGLAVTSDGQYVAIASGVNSRKLLLWKWREKEEPRPLPLMDYGLEQVSISPDGTLLAGVDNQYRLLVWEIPEGKLLYHQYSPAADAHYWRRPVFSPDGKTMAVISYSNRALRGGSVHLLDPKTGRAQGRLPVGSAVAISPDSRTAVVTVGTGMRLFDVATQKELRELGECHETPPALLAASTNDFIVTSGDDGSVRLWDAESMKLRRKWSAEHWIRALALSPDGRLVAGSSLDDAVHVWDVPGGNKLYHLPGHGPSGGRRTLGFMPDGKSLIAFGDDFDLRGWDMKTGKALFEHAIRPDGIAFPDPDDEAARFRKDLMMHNAIVPPDGKSLVLDMNGSCYLFDTGTGKQTAKWSSEGTFSNSLAVAPGSRFLLTSAWTRSETNSHVLSLVDLTTGTAVQRSVLPGSRNGPVAYSPDGRMFATALEEPEREILIYEKASGNVRGVLRGFRGRVRGLAFFPDNRRLASSLSDATVLIWDLAKTAEPARVGGPGGP
jgi:WD40 repeat protein